MADNQEEMIAEVRIITGYNEAVISTSDFKSLFDIAKRDLRSEYGDDLEFFVGEPINDESLFWLVCLFSKVASGEIGGIEVSLGDVRTHQPTEDPAFRFWQNKLATKTGKLNSGGVAGSHRRSARSGRSYGYE